MPHGTDLPPGGWSALLVGHQWPAAASLAALRAAAAQRSDGGLELHSYADLIGSITAGSLIHQDGVTAESLRALFSRGEDHARTLAEKQGAKHRSYDSAIRSVEALREDLAEIASSGNAAIHEVAESDAPVAAKVTAIVDIITQANTDANVKAASCVGNIHAATQSVLDLDATGASARAFAMSHGYDIDLHRCSPAPDAIRQRVHQHLDRQHSGAADSDAEAGAPFPESAAAVIVPAAASDTPAGGAAAAAAVTAPAAPAVPLEPSTPTAVAPAPAATQPMQAVPRPAIPATTARGAMPGYGADLRAPTAAPAPNPVNPATTPASAPVNQANVSGAMAPAVRRSIAVTPNPASPSVVTERAAPATENAGTRLRRLVEAVARQEPRLAWAVGERGDGSTVLVTDLAGGWTPPNVDIPAGVCLPAPGRRPGGLTALLDGATDVAIYCPGQPLSPEVGDPIPTSAHARDCTPVEDLGWELAQATRWRAELPRLAHTLVRAAAAATGFPDSELALLREHRNDAGAHVLAAYPREVDPAIVGNWQLLSAVDAFIEGERALAGYHFSWFQELR